MTIGERIRKQRNLKNKTLLQVAEELGVQEATVQRYESGNIKNLKQKTIARLADILETTPAYLMGWDETPPNAITPKHLYQIPVVGVIRAGVPVLAEQNIEGYELADVSTPEDYFYLRVKGDSMIDAGIKQNSLVLLRKQNMAEDGQIVACIVNGNEATLKRFKQQGDMIILMPENKSYEPILLPCSDFESGYAKICGVAVKVVINL